VRVVLSKRELEPHGRGKRAKKYCLEKNLIDHRRQRLSNHTRERQEEIGRVSGLRVSLGARMVKLDLAGTGVRLTTEVRSRAVISKDSNALSFRWDKSLLTAT